MKAYIQTDEKGNYYNVNAYIANDGFISLGWETQKFYQLSEIIEDKNPENVLVGGIGNVRKRLLQIGITPSTADLDYPAELQRFLGRKVWASTLEEIFRNEANWNIFIKPREDTKRFVGKVVRKYGDFIGLMQADKPTPIWCSEMVDFVTEWRCFIRYGEIFDVRQYKGAWDTKLDLSVVQDAVNEFVSAPNAYGLDFGIDKNGEMKLVEVNDGHSLGTYGLNAVKYAKFLSARWTQLTNTEDYLRF